MNKKFLAISMTLLMILGTLSVLVPQAHAQILPITANPTTGAPGTTVVVTPGLGATALPLHNIFVMFDTDVADPDEGQALIPFVGVAPAVIAAGDELYMDLNFVAVPHTYTAGEPIYLIGPLNPSIGAVTPAVVWPGDTRLRTVTVGATVYPAESTVALGDLDTLLAANLWQFQPTVVATATPGVGHTDQAPIDGIFTVGEEIVWDTDYNNLITPGDQRLNYNEYTDSVLLTDPTTAGRLSVPLGSVVRGHVFDYQEGLYVDANGNGIVDLGDTRVRDVVVPDVFYANSDPILAGDRDTQAGFVTSGFTTAFLPVAPFDEVYVDLNADLQYTYGEPVYNAAGFAVATGWVVTVGDVRQSYVAIGPGRTTFYLPGSTVAAGDADVGLAYTHFNNAGPFEEYFDLNGNLAYDCAIAGGIFTCDWIYRVATAGGPPAVGDVRLTNVAYSDNWSNLAVPAPADAQQAQILAAGTVVAAHDGDVCPVLPWEARCWTVAALQTRLLPIPGATTSPVTGQPNWMYYDVAVNGYTPEDTMYIDNDANAAISVGDERLTPVRTALALPMPALTQVADPGDWYMPHSIVQLGEADLALVPLSLTQFGAFPLVDPTSFAENVLDDNTYSTELMVQGAVDAAGNMGPFPLPAAGYGANQAFTFQIPAPLSPSGKPRGGNHVILLTSDVDPRSAAGFAAPWVNIGFLQAGAAIVIPGAGLKNPMTSLAWTDGAGGLPGLNFRWTYNDMDDFGAPPTTTAGPAWFWVRDLNVRVFLRPGVRDEYKPGWSHTLDTLRGTQGGASQLRQIIDRYPDYAILASASDSIGDFQFDFQVFAPISDVRIYVPSNFTFAHASSGYGDATTPDKIYSVWTDITNDYSYISVRVLGVDDPIAPDWQLVEIGRLPVPGSLLPSFVIVPGLYHVRLFQMRAPFAAGLYHFKIYVNGISIGAGNFPIVIVKSSLNPAYVTGLVALRGLAAATLVSGRVVASGTTSAGKYAEAVAYFGPLDFVTADATASYYRYWLFGLPAGVFDLTASASGYLKASSPITVNDGQSLRCDFRLDRGVEIRVTVWSKDTNGPIPWGNLWQLPYGTNNPYLPIDNGGNHRDILFRLLNQYEESVGYWGSDDVDPPYGPPWTLLTIDGKRAYSPLLLKSSTLPSSDSYTVTLTDSRGLPSARLDGHVPADTADLVEGISMGFYLVEIQVTGYVMAESDDWQRSFTIASNPGTYSLQVDLRRSNWLMATAVISNPAFAPLSSPTIVFVARSTDNLDKGLAAGTFPAGATQFMMVLEGFNCIYNLHRASTDYQDYGFEPVDFTLEVYMADVGTPYTGFRGMGWYLLKEESVEFHISYGDFAVAVSFHLDASSIEFVLRSMHLQQPMQLAPWTFPGAGIRLLLLDEYGNMTAILDPSFYGLVQDDGTIIGDPYDIDTAAIGLHGMLRVLFTGIDPGPVSALGGVYPTRIEEGLYHVSASTLGYVQVRDATVYVRASIGNDLGVDLVQGAQIRVEAEFRHENVATAFNGFVRVEVYNQDGTLVGASIYSGAQPNPNLNYYLPYNALEDWKLVPGPAEGAGTAAQPQRASLSRTYYGIPPATWANYPMMMPSDANRLSVPQGSIAAFDVFGFHWYYGWPDSRNEGLWANGWDTTNGMLLGDSGIRGSKDVQELDGWGDLTVRVWAFDPYGPDGVFDANGPDGIFGTDDDYTSGDLVEGGLSDFRAYAQTAEITNIEAPWGGATVVHVTLEEQPSVLGVVSWIDMYGNLRTLPWAQIIETSYNGTWASSATGRYRLWLSLSGGPHEFYVTTIGEEQLWQSFQFEITVAGPGDHTFRDITLPTSGMATPEFGAPVWGAAITLSALSIILSRRRSKNTRGS